MDAFRDPNDPRNGPKHHSGKPCIEKGCTDPAGTAWSPYWCHRHNVERMERIYASLNRIGRSLDKRSPSDGGAE